MPCSILSPGDLPNRINIFRWNPSLDRDSATIADDSGYPTPLALDVPCSLQPLAPTRWTDQERIGARMVYKVFMAVNYGLTTNDRITFTDCAGAFRKLLVVETRDLGGLGQAFEVRCIEAR